METFISNFRTSFYKPEIQKLVLHLPQVRILGTNNCVSTHQEPFKRRTENQYVLCCCDYDERVVGSFVHQIKYEYYGRNWYVSIEGIIL